MSSHSLSSNASLPSEQSCRRLRARRAASWAVSFERLLQDPLGVRYFSVSGSGRAVAVATGLLGRDPGPGLATWARPRPWWRGHRAAPKPRGRCLLARGAPGSALGQRAPRPATRGRVPLGRPLASVEVAGTASAVLEGGGSSEPPWVPREGCSCPRRPGKAETRRGGREDAARCLLRAAVWR